jgi:hypothetical protein
MAGWGDDPRLEELPVRVEESRAEDTVTVEKDGETRTVTSDHIAFHRFVEGLKEDFGLGGRPRPL